MHKWALKQFMRMVPHGRMLGQHLANKHFAQLLCTVPPPEAAAAEARLCHCGQNPCPHAMHVHASMPGLREGPDGLYAPISRSLGRYARKLNPATWGENHQRALRVFVADVTGGDYRTAPLPEKLYQAQTLTLSWHTMEGKLQVGPPDVAFNGHKWGICQICVMCSGMWHLCGICHICR